MPRLLILCEYPTLLGGERSMLSTLPAIAADGFDILVAAPQHGPLADELGTRGITQLSWATHDELGKRRPLDRLREDLANLVHHARPNLIHANSLSTARISGPVAAKHDVPSIGHLRDILKLAAQAVVDLNTHRRLVAVSRATRDFHVAQGLADPKCDVVNNGVDLAEFQPQTSTGYLHRELSLPANARLCAVIGQLGLRKGTDVALAAALQVADQFSNVHWLIVGERTSSKDESREFEDLLRSVAADEPLAGHVHFLGSRADVPALLAECEFLVHAARQEPLGRVLLEAAASGVAVVATDVGGTREIFPVEANAAILVPADDRFALADAVCSLLSDDNRRHRLGAAARMRAESAFDIRGAAANLVEQYRDVLG
jgi:glycosyltransferase involved in cell wall biosynthesis